MEFDTNGIYNGKQLDMPLHRVFPEKITGAFVNAPLPFLL